MENFYSVTQLNNHIKEMFDSAVEFHGISVYGEISSYNISNGVAYFNLKDENSLLPCTLFSPYRFEAPKIGDQVYVVGSMNYYVKGGRLSFNANSIHAYGKGVLYENFLKLKQELEDLGYFDVSKKRRIPEFVKRIGVVTSATGAVIRDIINVTTRRNSSVDIVLYPVKVQGVGAESEIVKGINFFDKEKNVDVIIVARGGGSAEDLQPFNTKIVADSVFACSTPVVSAVGHETDFTICDFVADLRAPTPSAAAEIVVWDKQDFLARLDAFFETTKMMLEHKINNIKNKIDRSFEKIGNFVIIKTQKIKNLLNFNFEKCYNLLDKKIIFLENRVKMHENHMRVVNPHNLAVLGYVKIKKDNAVIASVANLKVKDHISFEFVDGTVGAVVDELEKRGEK